MENSAIIYYIVNGLLLSSVFFEILGASRKFKLEVMFFWCLFFTFFGGIRWQVGGDWDQYYAIFHYCDFSNIFSFERNTLGNLEWLFVLINATCRYLFTDYWIYNIIICGIVQFSYYYTLKNICYNHFLLVYCVLFAMGTDYFVLRSHLSMAVGAISLVYIKKHYEIVQLKSIISHSKGSYFFKYVFTWFLSFSIHKQMIASLPLWWLGKIRLHWFFYFLFLISFFLIASIFQEYFMAIALVIGGEIGDKAVNYTDVEIGEGHTRGILNFILDIIFFAVFLYVRKKSGNNSVWYNLLLNMLLIQCAALYIFTGSFGELSRLSFQFALARGLLIAEMISYFETKSKFVRMVVWSCLLAYLCFRYIRLDSWYYFYLVNVPYTTIFDI